jgi:DNA invertase Pin-like site-specific DNA recombinase
MQIGYARVSTLDQNLDLQRDALTKAGCDRIFEEKKSGKAGTRRPAFEDALAFLRPRDVLVVWKLDRLGHELIKSGT